jgi:hypothetical protein
MRQDVHDAPDEGASSEESRREATRLLVLELHQAADVT